MFTSPSTDYDWRFRIFGISVEVQPFFWLAGLILVGQATFRSVQYSPGFDGVKANPTVTMLVAVFFFFLSILIHEMGHVLAFRHYGINSRILLHGFGGLAIPTGTYGRGYRRTRWHNVIISAAGPAFQALFAAALVGVCILFLSGVSFLPSLIFVTPNEFSGVLGGVDWFIVLWITIVSNVLWVIFNLLPILPMDGGHICDGICKDFFGPYQGRVYALWISIVTGVLVAIFAFQMKQTFAAIYVGYMAFQSLQELQNTSGRW